MYSNDKKVYSTESGDALTNLPKNFVSTLLVHGNWPGCTEAGRTQNVLPLPFPFSREAVAAVSPKKAIWAP